MRHSRFLAVVCLGLGLDFLPHRALAQGSNDPLTSVPKLVQLLESDGFEVNVGGFMVLNAVGNVCAGKIPTTWYNNVQPYIVAKLPLYGEKTARMIPPSYLLRQDEAVLLVGSTPPPMAYFSFQTFLLGRYNPKTNGYDPNTGGFFRPYEMLFSYVGDAVNSLTIRTTGSTPYNRPMALISTGHRKTQERLRAALVAAGYPAAVINTETLPPSLIRFGYENADQFLFLMRTALPVGGEAALEEYKKNVVDPNLSPMRVFRVRPKAEFPKDPLPAPVLRTRGTGHTEMDLYPTMEKLREAILIRHGGGFTADELDTFVPVPEGYPAIQRDVVWLGAGQEGSAGYGRDANYLSSPSFELPDDGFAIVYGVNHAATGKATYSGASVYVNKTLAAGVSGADSADFANFPDTASSYLPGEPDASKFYVWKVARNCYGDPLCMEAKSPCTPKIAPDAPVRIGFRAYAEPATKTGPSDVELLYDRVIVFRK